MSKTIRALIIGTETATSDLESGASLRLASIEQILVESDYEVTVSSRGSAKKFLQEDWDLIALVSFSTARYLRRARHKTKHLWFDPTDSWTLTRLSLIKTGDFKNFILLCRDLFWLWTAPKIDLLTFITQRDSKREELWWRKRSKPLVFPIKNLERTVLKSKEKRLVFVGDGNYGPNLQALAFLEEVSNLLPRGIEIHLFGNNLSTENSQFVCHGYVVNEELYRSSDIHLAPLSSGGGLKLKVAVPLWNGLRVVGTPESSNGFKRSPELVISTTIAEFAKEVSALLLQNLDSKQKPRSEIFEIDESVQISHWLTSHQ